VSRLLRTIGYYSYSYSRSSGDPIVELAKTLVKQQKSLDEDAEEENLEVDEKALERLRKLKDRYIKQEEKTQ